MGSCVVRPFFMSHTQSAETIHTQQQQKATTPKATPTGITGTKQKSYPKKALWKRCFRRRSSFHPTTTRGSSSSPTAESAPTRCFEVQDQELVTVLYLRIVRHGLLNNHNHSNKDHHQRQ